MRRINLRTVSAVLILGGAAIWMGRSHQTQDVAVERAPTATAVSPTPTSSALTAKALSVATNPADVTAKAPVALVKAQPLPFAPELAQYSILHRKVFLDEGEQAEKLRLLKNPALLRSLGTRLLQMPTDSSGLAEQNLAVDLLLEALRTGDSDTASEVLTTVVSDKQIEDSKMPTAARENVAGVKGEVLYRWSAQQPERTSDIARMLPGPVSQKIWQNVQTLQASNLAESEDTN